MESFHIGNHHDLSKDGGGEGQDQREGRGKLLAELVAHLRCCQNIQVGS